jgi:hypothetical protein
MGFDAKDPNGLRQDVSEEYFGAKVNHSSQQALCMHLLGVRIHHQHQTLRGKFRCSLSSQELREFRKIPPFTCKRLHGSQAHCISLAH